MYDFEKKKKSNIKRNLKEKETEKDTIWDKKYRKKSWNNYNFNFVHNTPIYPVSTNSGPMGKGTKNTKKIMKYKFAKGILTRAKKARLFFYLSPK